MGDLSRVDVRDKSGRPRASFPEPTLGALLGELFADRLKVGLRTWEGGRLGPPDAPATIVVRSRKALASVLQRPGQLGLARAYVTGDLDVEGDLLECLHLGAALDGVRPTARQWAALARLAGPSLLVPDGAPPEEVRLSGRVHSLARDRAAVTHHYDVSDEFYRLVLGPSMTYSCALFEHPAASLESAQEAKHELVSSKLALEPGMRLLDVGCGWGGMLEHAVTRHGVHAVGVTLSARQRSWAERRLSGANGKAELRLQDYRETEDGPYDAVSSIGMSEHVGEAKLAGYFEKLFALVRPGGRLLNHAISALPAGRVAGRWPTVLPRSARKAGAGFAPDSFMARYIFPDGELIEVGVVVSAMQAAGFEVRHVESLREHYGLTLRRWLVNLEDQWSVAVGIVGERRARAWRLYLAGSAFAFDTARIGVHQVLGVRPAKGRSGLALRPRFS